MHSETSLNLNDPYLDYPSLMDSIAQPIIFGSDISKIDNNESRDILVKLSSAEIKISKLAAACKARDSEIAKLEKANMDLKSQLISTNVEEISLSLQHMQFLNKALEEKFQESQIKIYNLEKSEKKELKDLRFTVDELEKDKAQLEDSVQNLRDQIGMMECEKNYLISRNAALEKRLKLFEATQDQGYELLPKKEIKERKQEPIQKSSLSSALKLFQEFPLTRDRHG